LKKTLLQILKITAFISVGVLLFWLVYRNQDINEIKKSLKEAHFWWLLFAVFIGFFSHISRAYRWALLIEPTGFKPRKITLFFAVMIMYLTNFAIPRSGEVVRCSVVSRYEKVPFTTVLGTVFTERVIDVIMLLILTVIVVITQFPVVSDFLYSNQAAQKNLSDFKQYTVFLVVFLVIVLISIILFFVFKNRLKKSKLFEKLKKIISDFVAGIKSILSLEHKWQFIAHSVIIWTMYFVMLYVAFKAFDFTKEYGIMVGLTAMVISSFGMVFPSPGGIGTWHFLVVQTLIIYGLQEKDGLVFAFGTHESQMIILIIAGLISLIAVSFLKIKPSTIEKKE